MSKQYISLEDIFWILRKSWSHISVSAVGGAVYESEDKTLFDLKSDFFSLSEWALPMPKTKI